jgi:hypothetical protein
MAFMSVLQGDWMMRPTRRYQTSAISDGLPNTKTRLAMGMLACGLLVFVFFLPPDISSLMPDITPQAKDGEP